jgi:phage terminase Nu1 subunit (DNA packaging protein)
MTDTAATAIKQAALVNLLTKAKQGKTLTSTDWAELRRIAPDPMPPTTPSWHHATLQDLATALGVSTRTLSSLRTRGAPITDDGPHDELAVRLWHASVRTSKDKPLKSAEGALADYAEQLEAVGPLTGKRQRSPADALKEAQRERVQLLNAEKRQELLRQAQNHARSILGRVEQELRQQLCTPAQISHLHGYCQRTLAQAEGDLVPFLRSRITASIATALAHGEQDLESA